MLRTLSLVALSAGTDKVGCLVFTAKGTWMNVVNGEVVGASTVDTLITKALLDLSSP